MFIAPGPTCGFLGGNSDNPIACASTISCALFASSGLPATLRCCNDFVNSCANLPAASRVGVLEAVSSGWCDLSTVTDAADSSSSTVSTDCPTVFDGTSVCVGDGQSLAQTVSILEPPGTFVACGSSFKLEEVLLTTYVGQKDEIAWTTTVFGTEGFGGRGAGGGATSSGATSETAREDAASQPTAAETRDGDKPATPVGAIVGGVIGALALVAIAGVAGLWVVMRQKRKKAGVDAAAAAAASMYGGSHVPSQYNSQHPSLTPLMSGVPKMDSPPEPVEVYGGSVPASLLGAENGAGGAYRGSWNAGVQPSNRLTVDAVRERLGHSPTPSGHWPQGYDAGALHEADTGHSAPRREQ